MSTTPTRNRDHPHAGNVVLYTWTLVGGETGDPVAVPVHNDKTIQIRGYDGSGAVSIEGSLDPAGGDFGVLSDPQGTDLSFSADGVHAILENIYRIRPVAAAGITSVTVVLMAR